MPLSEVRRRRRRQVARAAERMRRTATIIVNRINGPFHYFRRKRRERFRPFPLERFLRNENEINSPSDVRSVCQKEFLLPLPE